MDEQVTAEEVHRFWFADAIDDPQAARARSAVWFRSSPEFDQQIRDRFMPAMLAAGRGDFDSWKDAPRSCVSLAIVLDQFPRNAYRNTSSAFKYDDLALSATRHGVAAGHLEALSVPERAFLLMPYQHAEDIAIQRESVRLFERVCAEAPGDWRAFAENNLRFARAHLEIVERFGRFPHRNAALGRSATPGESEYLQGKPESFGQGGWRVGP
jgi:uncharacterized protein (DUF924 family)